MAKEQYKKIKRQCYHVGIRSEQGWYRSEFVTSEEDKWQQVKVL